MTTTPAKQTRKAIDPTTMDHELGLIRTTLVTLIDQLDESIDTTQFPALAFFNLLNVRKMARRTQEALWLVDQAVDLYARQRDLMHEEGRELRAAHEEIVREERR